MQSSPTSVTLDSLRLRMETFVVEREWQCFHTPRNLLLALCGEVGELAELFQWRGEVAPGLPGWRDDERARLGDELADVLLYLVRLADVSGVDLGRAVLRKLEINAQKYPVDRSRGSSSKYSAYVSSDDIQRIERAVDASLLGVAAGAAVGGPGAAAPAAGAPAAVGAAPAAPAAAAAGVTALAAAALAGAAAAAVAVGVVALALARRRR